MRCTQAHAPTLTAAKSRALPMTHGTGNPLPPAMTTPATVAVTSVTASHAARENSQIMRPGIRCTGRSMTIADPSAAMHRAESASLTREGTNPSTGPSALWASHAMNPTTTMVDTSTSDTMPRPRRPTVGAKRTASTIPTMMGGWIPPTRDTRAVTAAMPSMRGASRMPVLQSNARPVIFAESTPTPPSTARASAIASARRR